jgi:alpha-tubulin suppressor-like RCC1 family protein
MYRNGLKTHKTPKILKMAAGDAHLLLLDDNGRVFGLGWNGCAQLGPTKLSFITKPIDITKTILSQLPVSSIKRTITNVFAGGYSSWCEVTETKLSSRTDDVLYERYSYYGWGK